MTNNNKIIFISLAALVGVYLISYISNYKEDLIHKEIGEIIGNFDLSIVKDQQFIVLKYFDSENGLNLDITNKYFAKGIKDLKIKAYLGNYNIVLHLPKNLYTNTLVIENNGGTITIKFV